MVGPKAVAADSGDLGSAEDDLRGPDGRLYADRSLHTHAWIKGGRRARKRNERWRNNVSRSSEENDESEEMNDRLNDGTENDDGSTNRLRYTLL